MNTLQPICGSIESILYYKNVNSSRLKNLQGFGILEGWASTYKNN